MTTLSVAAVSLKPLGFLLGRETLDIFSQRSLVALGGDIVGLLIYDFLGDIALAAHRIAILETLR